MSGIRPLRPGSSLPPPRRWIRPLVASAASVAILVLTTAAVAARLPATFPVHFDAAGHPNGWASIGEFLGITLGALAVLGGLTTAVLYFAGRSEVLEYRYGSTVLGPASVLWSARIVAQIAGTGVALLLSAAGFWPWPGTLLPYVGLLLGGPILLVGVGGIVHRVRSASPRPGPHPGRPPGREMRFRCTACGGEFAAAAWHLLGPRIARAYYLRCSRCGERGWHEWEGWTGATTA